MRNSKLSSVSSTLGETVEVRQQVSSKLMAVGVGAQVAEREWGAASRAAFMSSTALLATFQRRVEAAHYVHRKNHVAILAPLIEVTPDVVADTRCTLRPNSSRSCSPPLTSLLLILLTTSQHGLKSHTSTT